MALSNLYVRQTHNFVCFILNVWAGCWRLDEHIAPYAGYNL